MTRRCCARNLDVQVAHLAELANGAATQRERADGRQPAKAEQQKAERWPQPDVLQDGAHEHQAPGGNEQPQRQALANLPLFDVATGASRRSGRNRLAERRQSGRLVVTTSTSLILPTAAGLHNQPAGPFVYGGREDGTHVRNATTSTATDSAGGVRAELTEGLGSGIDTRMGRAGRDVDRGRRVMKRMRSGGQRELGWRPARRGRRRLSGRFCPERRRYRNGWAVRRSQHHPRAPATRRRNLTRDAPVLPGAESARRRARPRRPRSGPPRSASRASAAGRRTVA